MIGTKQTQIEQRTKLYLQHHAQHLETLMVNYLGSRGCLILLALHPIAHKASNSE